MSRPLPIPLIDARRGRRVFELILILIGLSLADLGFTLWAHFFTDFHELNPLASDLLKGGFIGHLVLFKLTLTMLGAFIFWRLRRDVRAEVGLWAIVCVYVMLTVRWSDYTIDIQPGGTLAADGPRILFPLHQPTIPNLHDVPQIAPDTILVNEAVAVVA
jgi:hypothetical protein